MSRNKFNLEEFLKTANDLIYQETEVELQYWEEHLLTCYWFRMSNKEVAEDLRFMKSRYSDSHLFRNKAPELMIKLSQALNKTVDKYNIVEVLRRTWEKNTLANLLQNSIEDLFINFLIDITWDDQIKMLNDDNEETINFSDLDIEVIRMIFQGKTYKYITDNVKRGCKDDSCKCIPKCVCRYTYGYIRREIAGESWKNISMILGKPVAKKNFKAVVEQWHKDMKLFFWKLNQVTISSEAKNVHTKDCLSKTRLADFYALTTMFYFYLK